MSNDQQSERNFECELQFCIGHKTVIRFGPDRPSWTIKEYIDFLLKRYHGKITMENDGSSCSTFMFAFPAVENAQCFFHQFHEKLAPRMFSSDNKGRADFAPFKKSVRYKVYSERRETFDSSSVPDKAAT